jgi:hypothetical protein
LKSRHDGMHDAIATLSIEHKESSRFLSDTIINPRPQMQTRAMQSSFYIGWGQV